MFIHVFSNVIFYESYMYRCWFKLSSCRRPVYSYSVTLFALVKHFNSNSGRVLNSNLPNLLNYRSLPEAFQHSRIGTKLMDENPSICYYISPKGRGYDALSFDRYDFQRIKTDGDTSLITFYEKKAVSGNSLEWSKISEVIKKYSVSKLESDSNDGLRPCPIDHLEFGTYSSDDYLYLLKVLNRNVDLSTLKLPGVHIENYSGVYENIVRHHKHPGFTEGTSLSNDGFEELKYFSNLLEKDQQIFSELDSLIEKNPLFPF